MRCQLLSPSAISIVLIANYLIEFSSHVSAFSINRIRPNSQIIKPSTQRPLWKNIGRTVEGPFDSSSSSSGRFNAPNNSVVKRFSLRGKTRKLLLTTALLVSIFVRGLIHPVYAFGPKDTPKAITEPKSKGFWTNAAPIIATAGGVVLAKKTLRKQRSAKLANEDNRKMKKYQKDLSILSREQRDERRSAAESARREAEARKVADALEEATRLKKEEEERLAAEEEAARLKKEEEERLAAEEEAARLKKEEEERLAAEEEAARLKKEEEERLAAEEEAARLKKEEEERLAAEEAARLKKEEEERLAAEEEAARLKKEEDERLAAEEETARLKKEEEERLAAEEEAARLKKEEEERLAAEEEAARLKKEEKELLAAEEAAHIKTEAEDAATLGKGQDVKDRVELINQEEKYLAIEDLSERAYQILIDLGMVQVTPDPDDPSYDRSKDDEYVL